MATSQVEETLKRIMTEDGVVGVIIVNSAGLPIKSSMDNMISVHYAGLVQQLMAIARSVTKTDDPSNDLKILRLRTVKHEIIIIPEKQYIMIVVQTPTGSRPPM